MIEWRCQECLWEEDKDIYKYKVTTCFGSWKGYYVIDKCYLSVDYSLKLISVYKLRACVMEYVVNIPLCEDFTLDEKLRDKLKLLMLFS